MTDGPRVREITVSELIRRLEKASAAIEELQAERDAAQFMANGWHKQFRRVNKARHELKAEVERLRPVTCGECKHMRDVTLYTPRIRCECAGCPVEGETVYPDFSCSLGERRNDGL